LPERAAEYLTVENARLAELRSRYGAFKSPASNHTLWNAGPEIDLRYFRGDNRYVFQLSDGNSELNYLLTAFYLKSVDALGLFRRLQEDRLFGVQSFDFGDGSLISRDLLDGIRVTQTPSTQHCNNKPHYPSTDSLGS
jgi:hypothetical protein